ncbi:hypothetical protein B0H21DRAFT_761780 [Amylocystis lapponica]|nr:hypothetical protein B0H21DRAFT_761780 [Amylocystis lapponica]
MSSSLAPPSPVTQTKPRRMTSPSLPPPSPLNLPEPVYGYRRPPSPLRNGLTIDPETGEISDDSSMLQSEEDSHNGRQWGQRSHSPSPSVAKFAANIAQRVGSLMSPRSNALPTDDELEAEAERERERSRREAERIIMQEAEERRTVEERVLEMLHGSAAGSPKALRPPPPRSQTMPATPPSPVSSQKEYNWWTAAKNKLTPTKEPLTPAQQVIQETKAREKEIEKEKKKTSKKQKSTEWPSSPESRFEDPSFIKLGRAAAASTETPPRRPVSEAPSSPTPHAGMMSTPPSLAASPLRANDSRGNSPSRVPPPLYAQFDSSGVLDMPGTLLTIVKRFEKLERWTVGHVRALEERMDDVERWLVEKEREKESKTEPENGDVPEGFVNEMREELAELQGRVGELGREMAKMVTAPGNLSSGPSRNSAAIGRAPSTNSSIAVRSISATIATSPNSTPPRMSGSVSPPITTTPGASSRISRTRLPYPTGDYATPPESTLLNQGPFSPANSPPSSLTSKTRHLSISGLPSQVTAPMDKSPPGLPKAAVSPPALSPPNPPAWRPSSVSPTPRKRYTVALGGPIMSADRDRDNDRERTSSDRASTHSHTQSREISTAFFSASPLSTSTFNDDASDTDSESNAGGDTIGKAAARISGLSVPEYTRSPSTSPTGTPTPALKRARPQSMFGPQPTHHIASPSPVTPLNVRLRSRSTDRFGLGISDAGGAPLGGPAPQKFVDPLVVRRQTKDSQALPNAPKVMPGKPKVPVGQLVAFFDQEK